jgi:hypothetical protein
MRAATIGSRARGPKATNAPTAMAEADQKTAIPGSTRRIQLSRLARKYAMPAAAASLTTPSHGRLTIKWERSTSAFPQSTRDDFARLFVL